MLNSDGTRSTITSISDYTSGSLSSISVYATHTAYLFKKAIATGNMYEADYYYQLSYATTTINYNTSSFIPTQLVHEYEGTQNFVGVNGVYETDNDTINTPGNGAHDFIPASRSWFLAGFGTTGWIRTTAKIYVSNTGSTIELNVVYSLADDEFV